MKVTYYLGAGASADKIPIISQITHRLSIFKELIELPVFESIRSLENYSEFNEALSFLINNLKSNASIDTLAKKMYLSNNKKSLNELKAILSCFFIWIQAVNGYDWRYDTFLASILIKHGSEVAIPDDIKIVTWNYDIQMEMAFSKYINKRNSVLDYSSDFTKYRDRFDNITSTLKTLPIYNFDVDMDNQDSSLIRLNGVAGGNYSIVKQTDTKMVVPPPLFTSIAESDENKEQILTGIVTNYKSLLEHSFLNYAWETDNEISNFVRGKARLFTNKTDVLVIIGYSFPLFNRDIDRSIINGMENLRKIYIQDTKASNVKDRLKSIIDEQRQVDIVICNDVVQFFLPNELKM